MKNRFQSFLKNLALVLVSCVAGLALIEGGLRLYYANSYLPLSIGPVTLDVCRPHPTRGWELRPNVRTLSPQYGPDITYETNSRGLRDREHAYRKRSKFRVVILGDSFMEAQQVRLEDCLAQQLERTWKDRDVEVLNLGVSGYGTIQEYLYLIEEGLRYEPDLVLLGFYAVNDVDNNSAELSRLIFGPDSVQAFGRPYALNAGTADPDNINLPDMERVAAALANQARRVSESAPSNWLDASVAYRTVRRIIAQRRPPGAAQGYLLMPRMDPNLVVGSMLLEYIDSEQADGPRAADYARMWNEAWETTQAHLAAIDRAARDAGARFAVFSVPGIMQVEREFQRQAFRQWPGAKIDVNKPQRILESFCTAQGIPYFDLVPEFAGHASDAEGPLFVIDWHWSARGHALAADVLAERLESGGLVPARSH